jgi:hypothetical protein
MLVRVISEYKTRRRILQVGEVIDVPPESIPIFEGAVVAIHLSTPVPKTAPPVIATEPPPADPDNCQARKAGGRVCGAPLRAGLDGRLWCSDMSCQVPQDSPQLKKNKKTG